MLKLAPNNSLYPNQLNRLKNPPKTLFVNCDSWGEILKKPMLAIVGSRRPSSYGAAVCEQLAKEAASRGVVIVSGLALGIDSVAHKAALEAGGTTIAVLPSGLNNIYPSSHHSLAKQIIEQGGALISEYQPDEKIAFKGNFIARNRIVAGLSSAILIPEAAEKSGSLHTAQFAIDAGIDVLAVPGLITNPLATGSNNLIKTGASVVTNVSDVLNVLNIKDGESNKSKKINATNPEEFIVLTIISEGINDADEIQVKSKLPIEQFNQTITMLEINGQIKPAGANTWHLT